MNMKEGDLFRAIYSDLLTLETEPFELADQMADFRSKILTQDLTKLSSEADYMALALDLCRSLGFTLTGDLTREGLVDLINLAPSESLDSLLIGRIDPLEPLDNYKAQDNPLIQLKLSLMGRKGRWGILTNLSHWLLLAPEPGEKKFIALDLRDILARESQAEFQLFWRLFSRAAFAHKPSTPSLVASLDLQDQEKRDLMAKAFLNVLKGTPERPGILTIFGELLLGGTIGTYWAKDQVDLKSLLDAAIRVVFRVVFLAYLEDTNPQVKLHDWDLGYGPRAVFADLEIAVKLTSGDWTSEENLFWRRFSNLLTADPIDLSSPRAYPWSAPAPLLNFGLLDPALSKWNLGGLRLKEAELRAILAPLLRETGSKDWDFVAMGPNRLAAIYESLSQLEFHLAPENAKSLANTMAMEDLKAQENPLALEDYGADPAATRLRPFLAYSSLPKGRLSLGDFGLNRKNKGVYYTSDSLAQPLTARGVAKLTEEPFKGRSLLEARILDPACGVGNLLVWALKNLTDLALLTLGEDEKLRASLATEMALINENPETQRLKESGAAVDELAALKRVILRETIYGVDREATALELARVVLALETRVVGLEPVFTGANLKVGDSLIGANYAAMAETVKKAGETLDLSFIKDKARNLAEEYALAKKAWVGQEAKIKDRYESVILPLINDLNLYYNIFNYYDILAKVDPKNQSSLLTLLGNLAGGPKKKTEFTRHIGEITEYKAQFSFFNWEVEFFEVFESLSPGFDVIIGNPPWDKTKFENPLFLAKRQEDYRSLSQGRKTEVLAAALAEPESKAKYVAQKERAAILKALLRKKYPLNSGSGDGDLFRYFVEKALDLLTSNGRLSFIIPTGLLIEDNSTVIRRQILLNHTLSRFDGFENRRGLFPAVDSRCKFGLIQIEKTPPAPDNAPLTRFNLTDPKDLENEAGVFAYPLRTVKITSPDHLAYMEVLGGKGDLKILERMYAKFPPLSESWLDLTNELHATKDKGLFKDTFRQGLIPLYKGAMIRPYQVGVGPPQAWLDPRELDDRLRDIEVRKILNDLKSLKALNKNHLARPTVRAAWKKELLAYLKSQKVGDLASYVQFGRNFPRLSLRAIARDTNERTLVAALLPPNVGAQNSLWVSVAGDYYLSLEEPTILLRPIPLERLLFAQAIFNSLPVDWALRALVGSNVNKTYLYRLPCPQPTAAELKDNPLYRSMVEDSALLSLDQSPGLLAAIPRLGELAPRRLSQGEFISLKAGLDLKVAQIYGLNPEDLKRLLKGFPVLRRKDPNFVAILEELIQKAI
ncbi:MAG: Eco57I restriction-modification methylase domain-containing protein [Deltaproteobacteria bacterium]|jgi:hypothetical protein|nr:Eco57I restriction-modification methylase domain-containing protein [Deltaproteobacteria bacterium]